MREWLFGDEGAGGPDQEAVDSKNESFKGNDTETETEREALCSKSMRSAL